MYEVVMIEQNGRSLSSPYKYFSATCDVYSICLPLKVPECSAMPDRGDGMMPPGCADRFKPSTRVSNIVASTVFIAGL
jgi:hypothetical protein